MTIEQRVLANLTQRNTTVRGMAMSIGAPVASTRRVLNKLVDDGKAVKWLDGTHVEYSTPKEGTTEQRGCSTGLFVDPSGGYVYNHDNDTYIVFVKAARDGHYEVSGEDMRALRRRYSDHDGQPATVNEIERDFGIPRRILTGLLRKMGITHDREPFTVEELLGKTDEELLDDAILQRREAINQKLVTAKWEETKRDAGKYRSLVHDLPELRRKANLWDNHGQRIQEAVQGALETNDEGWTMPEAENLVTGEYCVPGCLVLPVKDLHLGRYGWSPEVGENYDMSIAENILARGLQSLTTRAQRLLKGCPEEIVFVLGHDWFNSDNFQGRTTSTRYAQDNDGTPAEVLLRGYLAAKEACQFLASRCHRLKVIVVEGNHDRYTADGLRLYLAATFGERGLLLPSTPGIEVTRSMRSRQWTTYGQNLIYSAHGDDVSSNDLFMAAATETGEDWLKPHKLL